MKNNMNNLISEELKKATLLFNYNTKKTLTENIDERMTLWMESLISVQIYTSIGVMVTFSVCKDWTHSILRAGGHAYGYPCWKDAQSTECGKSA